MRFIIATTGHYIINKLKMLLWIFTSLIRY
nr:MAG TPA: hypothetical protein [Caudoviricetes sp.]